MTDFEEYIDLFSKECFKKWKPLPRGVWIGEKTLEYLQRVAMEAGTSCGKTTLKQE